MSTITVLLDDGIVGNSGAKTLHFQLRSAIINGGTTNYQREWTKTFTDNVSDTIELIDGQWQVTGLIPGRTIAFTVDGDADFVDLIATNLNIPANTPVVTITQAVNAWLAAHVDTGGGGGGSVSNSDIAAFVAASGATRTAVDARVTAVGDASYAPIATLTETIQDTVNALIQAGANVTKSYDDTAGTLTISATGGGGGGTDAEVVRDTIAGALVASTGINITVDDPGDTITISVAGIPASAITTGTLPIARGGTGAASASAALTALGAEGTANKNTANGYAGLDATGKVAAAQLPSYVDDVLEAANLAGFPGTGETGKIYVALDTNKTYRWSGSAYTEISASLAIGTTSSTAKAGDYQPAWTDVTSKPAVIAAGVDAAAARTAIGAGTGDVTTSGTQTLTNKRITPRIGTTASSATPAINTDTTDQFTITALAAAITSMSSGLSGTPTDGQRLLVRIKDNGTARAITWGTSWRAIGVTLPTTTVVSKTMYVGAVWNAADSKWDVLAVGQES